MGMFLKKYSTYIKIYNSFFYTLNILCENPQRNTSDFYIFKLYFRFILINLEKVKNYEEVNEDIFYCVYIL